MAVAYDPTDQKFRFELALQIYRRVSTARIELGRQLGMTTLPELPDPLSPIARPRAFRDCQERIADESHNAPTMCHRVVDELIAGATKAGDVEWLGEKSFTEGAWRTARNRVGRSPPPQPIRRARDPNEPEPMPPMGADWPAILADIEAHKAKA